MKLIRLLGLGILTLAFVHLSWARAEKSMLGLPLPELKLEFLSGKAPAAGHAMIVEFWATWCPPCRDSIPHLNKIFAQYKDRGLVIVGITDEKLGVVQGFLKKLPMDYLTALDKNGAYGSQFKITGIPHAVLVDKSGKIVWEGHPMSITTSQIEKLLP